LEQGFRTVPDNAKPWAYYWWLNGNVDERTITRDLEAMKQVGFGGMLMFDARGYHDDVNHVPAPPPKMEFMSKEWRRLLKHTITEAGRLGLEVSVTSAVAPARSKGRGKSATMRRRSLSGPPPRYAGRSSVSS